MNKIDGNHVAGRLLQFAVDIIKIAEKLPNTYTGKHISKQVLRSGTSPGANYEEARGAESRKDFIHKLGIVLKELKESRFWLLLIEKSELLDSSIIKNIINECEQLCAMVAKSILTAKKNR